MNDKIAAIQNLPLHVYVGLTEIKSESGNAILTAVVNQNALNPSGFYHGGVMYLLCDVCAYSGVISALNDNEDAVTHDIHFSVLRPAKLGQTITYSSKIIKRGKSLYFIDVEAKCADKIIATARVTKSVISM